MSQVVERECQCERVGRKDYFQTKTFLFFPSSPKKPKNKKTKLSVVD